MVGDITARAAPQVIRLAVTYALLDTKERVELEHLEAALAVWDYCEASARWIFGDATGDPLADELLQALRHAGKAGLTRSELRDVVGGRTDAARIEIALSVLMVRGLARFADETTGGRSAQRWWSGRGS